MESDGHEIATIHVPLPESGEYSITVVPKADATAADTYSIEVTGMMLYL